MKSNSLIFISCAFCYCKIRPPVCIVWIAIFVLCSNEKLSARSCTIVFFSFPAKKKWKTRYWTVWIVLMTLFVCIWLDEILFISLYFRSLHLLNEFNIHFFHNPSLSFYLFGTTFYVHFCNYVNLDLITFHDAIESTNEYSAWILLILRYENCFFLIFYVMRRNQLLLVIVFQNRWMNKSLWERLCQWYSP